MMFSPTCARARLRLQQRAAGLAPAEALRLEEHLSGCEGCREQAVLLDELSVLARGFDPALLPFARERAISSALARVGAQPAAEPRTRIVVFAGFGAALAAAAAVALVLWLRPDAPVDRVLAGGIEARGHALAAGDALAAGEELFAPNGAELALAHARVALHAGTRVRWDARDDALALVAGVVSVEVDPSRHQRFSVRTARFRAEVLGTRFEVDLDGVRVERGTVRVVATDGQVLAPGVTAGQRFVFAAPAPAQPPVAAAPEAVPERAETAAAPAPVERASARERDSAVRELLKRARTGLAARDAASARRALQAALALRPTTALRAEALSLSADCALAEGDVDAAVRAYLQVARGFTGLPAAQNALFAAARLQAEHGRDRAAAELFQQYVERYPNGGLADDARRRLGALRK